MTERTAGLIECSAAGWAQPLAPTGEISVIRRVVLPFQQAGVFPVVVLTGAEDRGIRSQLADAGVIFLRCEAREPIEALQAGLAFLGQRCRQVMYAPANAPFFTSETIFTLLDTAGEAVIPTYHGRGGHPVLLRREVFPALAHYSGPEGLRGALRQIDSRRVSVEDEGVVQNARDEAALAGNVRSHNATLVQPVVQLSIARESRFYDRRVKLLLWLLEDTCNLRQACGYMDLSIGKAWSLLNTLEQELGYPVVHRRQGGRGGGQTTLTPAGRTFLRAAETFETQVYAGARAAFRRLFQDSGIL